MKYLKIIIPILFALAVALGIYQSQFNESKPLSMVSQNSGNDSLEDYYNATKGMAPQDQVSNISFFAVGDIMLSRSVASQMKRYGTDPQWPFNNIADTLSTTNFNFGNLESPYSGSNDFSPPNSFLFNAPLWTLPGLLQNNFKVLNLANNHGLDQGKEGLFYTQKLLQENGVTHVGTGASQSEAWRGSVYTTKGIRVGFIGASYASTNDGGKSKTNYTARLGDEELLQQSIAELKTRSDFIVVTMHAGTEYVRLPNESQITFARTAIDFGADMVIGAHPHWIQTTEQYKGKYIFYSLGNFIFDQEWSQDTKEGLMLKISLSKQGSCAGNPQAACGNTLQGSNLGAKLKQIELVPVIIENYGQPRLATEVEKEKIFKKIGATTTVITP